MDDELRDGLDHVQIRLLQDAYADLVNRGAWPELEEIVRADAPITLDTRAQPELRFQGPHDVAEFLSGAIRRFSFFQFAILSTRVQLRLGADPNAAGARMYICETRRDAESGDWTRAFGVYHDRCARIDGRWWIAGRHYHSLARDSEPTTYSFPADQPF